MVPPELGEPLLQVSPRRVSSVIQGPGLEPLCMSLAVTHLPRHAALHTTLTIIFYEHSMNRTEWMHKSNLYMISQKSQISIYIYSVCRM